MPAPRSVRVETSGRAQVSAFFEENIFRKMDSSVRNGLQGARFRCLCAANFFLHLYVYLLIPLLSARLGQFGAGVAPVAWAVAAFALGMALPGPFAARLMERRSRKSVCLGAVAVLGFCATPAYVRAAAPVHFVLLYGLQGVAFGLAQTALGTTLVNDVLPSRERDRGDVCYAWAGRVGIPLGVMLGLLLVRFVPMPQAWWWTLLPCTFAFLLVGQTPVPLKAPVSVPWVTWDRFLLPHTLPLSFTLFAAPFVLGGLVAAQGIKGMTCLAAGCAAACLFRMEDRLRAGRRAALAVGYTLLLLGLAGMAFSDGMGWGWLPLFFAGWGVASVSAAHLKHWLVLSDHCQRGTAQNTYMLSWRAGFACGFCVAAFRPDAAVSCAQPLCLLCLAAYFLWPGRKPL